MNLDDNAAGFAQKLRLAERYRFHTLSEGYRGFRASEFFGLLRRIAHLDQAAGVILIIDTAKKVFNPMDKVESSAFLKVVRQFAMKGGTAISLAHANKRPGPDGRTIPGGVSDLVDDVDCAYTLRVISEPGAAEKRVEFSNYKGRGGVVQQIVYGFSAKSKQSYQQLLDSVRVVDDVDIVELAPECSNQTAREIVRVAQECIAGGTTQRMALAAAIQARTGCSRNEALQALDTHRAGSRSALLVGSDGTSRCTNL